MDLVVEAWKLVAKIESSSGKGEVTSLSKAYLKLAESDPEGQTLKLTIDISQHGEKVDFISRC